MNQHGRIARSGPAALVLFVLAGTFGLLAGAGADTCTCDILLWSDYRWMNPWWGLECNEHCGHGYVGSSCDSAHGAGCGAMTGSVQLRHPSGSVFDDLNCADDHRTCFRGPSACDDGGSWGNACNADIDHCIPGGNLSGAWECNGLSDSERVLQAVARGTFPGACGTNWFNVFEHIDEHDPFCCDDSMGNFNVSTWTAEGSSSVALSASDTNCNGGSQGGVYPHCGTFGATLTVDMSCFTTLSGGGGGGEDPPPPTVQSGAPAGAKSRVTGPVFDELLAVAESLDRRERKMTEAAGESLAGEVAGRAFALGVDAPVEELARLLVDAGWAELDRDLCRVETMGKEGACGAKERLVKRLDTAFRALSGGVAIREFRGGASLSDRPPAPPSSPPRTRSE